MKKKCKKFREAKMPRYLPGQVNYNVLRNDLIEFNKHRYNIFAASPRVDDKPFRMNPKYYVNSSRLGSDKDRLQQIFKENKILLRKINIINRTGGKVDSFNPNAYVRYSKWRAHAFKMQSIAKQNKNIYEMIKNAKSVYPVKEMNKFWKHVLEKLVHTCKFPLYILQKKTLDQILHEQPSISKNAGALITNQYNCGCPKKVERPRCFMDFQVKEGVYLGRIIIELYQDFVPVTVQNFISLCSKEDGLTYKMCPIHRVAPGKFIETGDITKGNGKGGTSIYGTTFAEENYKLKHSRPGVLSMVRVGNSLNNSMFSITLTAMESFDGNRVVFGKVIYGMETLCKINDLGRKFGKPVVTIFIQNCGKFIKGTTPICLKSFHYKHSIFSK